MRQTNNVITHLSAQYRAILKNAIVTGCATLAAATGIYGLGGAMTDAQAASNDKAPNAEGAAEPAEDTWYFAYGTADATQDEYKKGPDGKYNKLEVTFNPDYVPPTEEGGEEGDGTEPPAAGGDEGEKTPANVTIKAGVYGLDSGTSVTSGATLNIEKDAYLYSQKGDLVVDSSTVNNNQLLEGRTVTINKSTINIEGKNTASSDTIKIGGYANVHGTSDITYNYQADYNGTFEINESTVSLGDRAALIADRELNINSGSNITLGGNQNNQSADSLGAGGAFIVVNEQISKPEETGKGGNLRVNDTNITISAGKGGTIAANHVKMSGGELNVESGGKLLLERGAIKLNTNKNERQWFDGSGYSNSAIGGHREGFDAKGDQTYSNTKVNIGDKATMYIGGQRGKVTAPTNVTGQGLNVTFDDGSVVDLNGLLNINASTDTDRTVVEFKNSSKINNQGTGEIIIGNGSMLKIEAGTSTSAQNIDSLDIERADYSSLGTINNSGTVAVTKGWVKAKKLSDFGVNEEQPNKGGKLQLENNSIVQVDQDFTVNTSSFSGDTAIVQNGSTSANANPTLYGKNVSFTVNKDPNAASDSTNKINLVADKLLIERVNADDTSGTGDDLVDVTINQEQVKAMVLAGKEAATLDRDPDSPAKNAIELAKKAHEALSDLNFGAQNRLDAASKTDLALKVTNAKIELSDSLYAVDNPQEEGQVKTDLYMDSGSVLSVYGGTWRTQNVVLQNGAAMGVNNGSKIVSGGSIEVGSQSALAVDGKSSVDSQNIFAGPNSDIYVNDGSTLKGQDFIAKDTTRITADHGSTITGNNITAGSGSKIIVDNASNMSGDNITFGDSSNIKLDNGSNLHSAALSLENASTLTLDSGSVMVSDDVTLKDNATLRVEWGSQGSSKSLNAGSGSKVNIYNDASWSGTNVNLGSGSTLEVDSASSLSGSAITLAEGSKLNVFQTSKVDATSVELGNNSKLWVNTSSTLNAGDLTLNSGSSLSVDSSSTIEGNNLVIEGSGNSAAADGQPDELENSLYEANKINRGSTISFNTVNVGSGANLAFEDSTLNIKGDGKTDTVDIMGGSNITISGGTLNFNDAGDTLSLKYDGVAGPEDHKSGNFTIGDGNSGYSKVTLKDGATVKVDVSSMFAHDAIIEKSEADQLYDMLVEGTSNGLFELTGVNVDSGFPSPGVNNEVNFDDILDEGSDNTSTSKLVTDITKATTVTNMDEGDRIAGGYKAIKTKANQTYINVVDNHTLGLYGTVSGSKNVIEDVNGNVAGVHLESNGVLNLYGDVAEQRNIGAVSGAGTLRVQNGDYAFVNKDGTNADITVDKLVSRYEVPSSENSPESKADIRSKITANAIKARNIDVSDTNIKAKNITISGVGTFYAKNTTIDVNGDVDLSQATGKIMEDSPSSALKQAYGSVLDGTDMTANLVKAANIALLGGSNVDVAKSVTADNITIIGGSSLVADTIRLNNNRGTLYVGDSEGNIGDNASGSTHGNLVAKTTLDLNGGTLVVDPSYSSSTSTVFTPSFDPNGTNRITGNIVVGQNSALGLGGTEENFRKSLANFQVNGSLDPNKYASYVYIDQNGIDIGKYKLVTGGEDIKTLQNIAQTSNSSVYMGKGSALEVTANALYGSSKPVFDNFGNKIVETQGGTLVVPATFDGSKNGDISKLFGTNANLIAGTTEGIKVTTPGGAFVGYITNSSQLQGKEEISLTPNGDGNGGGNNPGTDPDDTNGVNKLYNASKDVARYVLAATINNEGKSYNTYDDFANALKTSGDAAYNSHGLATVKNEQGSLFLGQALDVDGGAHVEKATRLATYAGAALAAQQVATMTSDALASRMGAHNGARERVYETYQGYNLPPRVVHEDVSGQGSTLWFTPNYRTASSDGFAAGDKSYGNDINLYGATFGFDYSVPNSATAGAFLTFGTGDTKGTGLGKDVQNDVSYYGGGIYSGFSPSKNVDFLTELSYTKVRNDVKYKTGVKDWNDMAAKIDSSALSFGLGARYTYASDAGTLQPHLGIRYTRLDSSDYDVTVNSKTIAKNKNDALNIISVPVGASLATEYRNGNWSFRPELDLTVTANFGKTEQAGQTRFVGVYGKSLDTKTEIVDRITYGAKLGFTAQSDTVEFGLDVGYTGSENTKEVGVNAKVAAHF